MVLDVGLGLAAACGIIGLAGLIRPHWVVSSNLPQTRTMALGGWVVIGCVVLTAGAAGDSLFPASADGDVSRTGAAQSIWLAPRYHIYDGVTLYWGADHHLVGTVIGANPHLVGPTGRVFSGVKLRRPDGTTVWKDRDAIETGRWWFIKRTDPNKTRGHLSTYAY